MSEMKLQNLPLLCSNIMLFPGVQAPQKHAPCSVPTADGDAGGYRRAAIISKVENNQMNLGRGLRLFMLFGCQPAGSSLSYLQLSWLTTY